MKNMNKAIRYAGAAILIIISCVFGYLSVSQFLKELQLPLILHTYLPQTYLIAMVFIAAFAVKMIEEN